MEMGRHEKLIFHIDVNSAFLSWEAIHNLQHGESVDLREIPAIVGGDLKTRHGIVLAKSIPAKKFKIQTGEAVWQACQKCPNLVIVSPHYDRYIRCSNAMHAILQEYTPIIQRFSVDESFLDFSDMKNHYPDPEELAHAIRERIKNELGFTVNIGISVNKLLAKVASDLKKPDRVHTLWPVEIKDKMWPLPVEDLFMVGRATAPKLRKLNIMTIGDLANYNLDILKHALKSHGELIWNYANGIEDSTVRQSNYIGMKGIGNSTTIPFDVEERVTAHKVLLSLAETVGMRLRDSQNTCQLIGMHTRTNELISYSRQRKLSFRTDSTRVIAEIACELFDEAWRGEPIRHLGIRITELHSNEVRQVSLFDEKFTERDMKLDKALDDIRMRFGSHSVVRGTFLHSGLNAITGGGGGDDAPQMTSLL